MAVVATFGPPMRIDGPLPVAPKYGLLNTATVVVEDDERWGNGAQVYAYPTDTGYSHDPCSTGSFRTKRAAAAPPLPTFESFTAYLPETCTSSRIVSQEVFTARAQLAFGARESAIYESVLAHGGALNGSGQPYMGDSNLVVLNGGTATSPAESLALLEEAIGRTYVQGLIHATPDTIIAWTFPGPSIDREGNHLETRNGTSVVSGDGYIDVVPDTHAGALTSRQAWAFATGPVEIRREARIRILPDELSQALDRSQNIVTYLAERDALITWDTFLQVGVLVDRSLS